MRITRAVVDLRQNGKIASQLLFGERFLIEKSHPERSFGMAKCGYAGWVENAALAKARPATHQVSALATFIYSLPDLKSEPVMRLSFSSKITVVSTNAGFAKTPEGYVFAAHLSNQKAHDFVAEAGKFLNVPYLWGGRSSFGVDCSGLVQLALGSARINAPRDSGPQELMPEFVPIPPNSSLRRGDLIFWKGHVAIAQSARMLLHANAHDMIVSKEEINHVKDRILAASGGKITSIRRVLT